MPLYMYFIILITIILVGSIATILVGRSKENKEGNPKYDKQTKGIFAGLSIYYLIATLIAIIALILYITG